MGKTVAIIAAAGKGDRFDGSLPKQYHRLKDGTVILTEVIEKFISHPEIELVVTTVDPSHLSYYHHAIQNIADTAGKLLTPVYGGSERHLSVLNALEALNKHQPGLVLIHDGARPFVSQVLISNIIKATKNHGAAVPLISSFETLKEIKGGFISKTVDRSRIFKTQTPQGFKFDALYQLARQNNKTLTDDSQLFERAGKRVAAVEGEIANIKITFKEDIT